MCVPAVQHRQVESKNSPSNVNFCPMSSGLDPKSVFDPPSSLQVPGGGVASSDSGKLINILYQ